MTILINDLPCESEAGERLTNVLNRSGVEPSQVCYHPQLGPIQTGDTCLVAVNGGLVRTCATAVSGERKFPGAN
jgi:formate dehydrogenase major subunit